MLCVRGCSLFCVSGLQYSVPRRSCIILFVLGLHYAVPEGWSILCFGVVLFSVPGLCYALCAILCLRVVIHALLWGWATLCIPGLQYTLGLNIFTCAVVPFSVSLGCGIPCFLEWQYILCARIAVYYLSPGWGIVCVLRLNYTMSQGFAIFWGYSILCPPGWRYAPCPKDGVYFGSQERWNNVV